MHIIIPTLAIVMVISCVLARNVQNKIMSDLSPFSFADDMLIINTGSIFSVHRSLVECVELQYNPNAMQHKYYEMTIHIVTTAGRGKRIRYRGSRSGVQPQEMAAAFMAHGMKCVVNES